jgi:hypothetical protein
LRASVATTERTADRVVIVLHDRFHIPARPVATALRYLSIIAGCACLLLAAVCVAIACQVFIQTGVFAESYAIVGLISGVLALLALKLASLWK